ncbi:hypothetical protein GGS24DRAFT_506444 [Hypoxylon argillaceum]|nr:hypothetical protein GGS24DRAFT_506444 [Hypoxylon argillaceum]
MRLSALSPLVLASCNALPQAGATTSIAPLDPKAVPAAPQTLPLCCCCTSPYARDEPAPAHAVSGECSEAGTRDVCGSGYTGASGFTMGGLEGRPDRIAARCAVSRCGAMRFVE